MVDPLLRAGVACTPLIASPEEWINRRVETIELLSREETRRRVSIDFTLTEEQLTELEIGDGVVVPISVLTKEPRRNFDLRDESGRAVPVLGREQNGELAHIALANAAVRVLPKDITPEEFGDLVADLGDIVRSAITAAEESLGAFVDKADSGDAIRLAIWSDPTCQSLLTTLCPTTLCSHASLRAVLGDVF